MIDRVYFKNNLSFDEAELYFDNGLMVFTGSSGAGKSVVFKSILSVFGFFDVSASLVEVSLDDKIDLEGIQNEDINTFKATKDKQTRYFINNQSIGKKNIKADFIKYLSARNYEDFNHSYILESIDKICAFFDSEFLVTLNDFKQSFNAYNKAKDELEKLEKEEDRINDLKDFLSYEIQKIEKINPKLDEYDELLSIKTRLSKKDKIDNAKQKSEGIFEYEKYVLDFLKLKDINADFFCDCMEELKDAFYDDFDDDEYDIESVLNRLEELNYLIKKYGDIQNAISELENKKQELLKYENIEFTKTNLEKEVKNHFQKANTLAKKISQIRKHHTKQYEEKINFYLQKLYLKDLKLSLEEVSLGSFGIDKVELDLKGAVLKNISFGELNRLRLAFLASECNLIKSANGIIFLDEIDANLSGKEAESVALVLLELSKFYQIFAISHLPSLSAKAKKHFLVEKNNDKSIVYEIKQEERAKEIARMISGKNLSKEALEFAKSLLG